jgi:hypothetical protein
MEQKLVKHLQQVELEALLVVEVPPMLQQTVVMEVVGLLQE